MFCSGHSCLNCLLCSCNPPPAKEEFKKEIEASEKDSDETTAPV
jgi:hypothetical protein